MADAIENRALNLIFGTLGHVGVEPFPKSWARWRLLRQIGTSTFHAEHHLRRLQRERGEGAHREAGGTAVVHRGDDRDACGEVPQHLAELRRVEITPLINDVTHARTLRQSGTPHASRRARAAAKPGLRPGW